jgi:60 kDa SS-A/Ro ribonucleoprotein
MVTNATKGFSGWAAALVPQARPTVAPSAAPAGAEALERLRRFARTGTLEDALVAGASTSLEGLAAHTAALSTAQQAALADACALPDDLLPALLAAQLSRAAPAEAERIFARQVTSGVQVRAFVEAMRSGLVGRTSLGSLGRRLVQGWLDAQPDDALLDAAAPDAPFDDLPTLADVLRLVHPRPASPARAALYGALLGRGPGASTERLAELEALVRAGALRTVLAHLEELVLRGVLESEPLAALLAHRLATEPAAAGPLALLDAMTASGPSLPGPIQEALGALLDRATAGFDAAGTAVLVDVSGSMCGALAGRRGLRPIDQAVALASALERSGAATVAFAERIWAPAPHAAASVRARTAALASLGGDRSDLELALAHVSRQPGPLRTVVVLSDREATLTTPAARWAWAAIARAHPGVKRVSVDLDPAALVRAPADDALQVIGFEDRLLAVLK